MPQLVAVTVKRGNKTNIFRIFSLVLLKFCHFMYANAHTLKNIKSSILEAEIHLESYRHCLGQVGYAHIKALL